MPIDASIPLSATQPKAPDLLGQATQAFTLKAAMLQSRQAEQQQGAQELLASVFSDPASTQPDPNLPSMHTLTPEAWQKLQSNPIAFNKAKDAERQMLTDFAKKEELVQKKRAAQKQWMGNAAVTLALKQEQTKATDEAMQPEIDAAIAAGKAQGFDLPPGINMERVKQYAQQNPEYQKRQLRSTQPETPHEVGMRKASERRAAASEKTAADKKQSEEDKKLEPDELNFMARQALRGDTSVFQNIGRGSQGAQNIQALRKEIMKEAKKQNIAPEQLAAINAEFQGLKAGERTLGTRTANIEMAVTEAQNMAPLALQASEKVNRTQFPTLNALLIAAEKGTGGDDVVRLGIATNSLINIYARAISPTGVPTVSDKDHARELLSSAWSKGQYKTGVDQLMKEMDAARKSPGQVRQSFREAVSGQEGGAAGRPDNPESGPGKRLVYDPASGTLKPQ